MELDHSGKLSASPASPAGKPFQFNTWIAWSVMLLVGSFLIFFHISHDSLWGDEAYTYSRINPDLLQIPEVIGKTDTHPPLYYVACKVFAELFGYARGTLRSFAGLGLLATTILLGAGPISRLFNQRVGLIFAFLMLFSSMNLFHAQEIRMYSWATFLMTACATTGFLYVRDGKKSDLIFFGLSSLGGLYIHYYVTLGVFFVHLFLLCWIILRKRHLLWPFLAESLVAASLFAPWLFFLVKQVAGVSSGFWIGKPSLYALYNIFRLPFGVPGGFFPNSNYLLAGSLVYLGSGLVAAYRNRQKPIFASLALPVFSAVLIFALVYSFLVRPILAERYMLPLWGLLFLVIAAEIDHFLKSTKRIARGYSHLFLVCYAALALPAMQILYFVEFKSPMNDIVHFGKTHFHEKQAFLHFDDTTLYLFAIEFPDYSQFLYKSPSTITDYTAHYQESYGKAQFQVITDLRQISENFAQIWLVSPDSDNVKLFQQLAFSATPNRRPALYSPQLLTSRIEVEKAATRGIIRFTTPLQNASTDMALVNLPTR
ncbi:MAG: glycosyltransferase family 39 protein [Proteobacteria bacterium]|nr:glycosyltransferase family 39 protein [Pseudomonadota bacterium]MBU1738203.1 glycosyltransferase family 39 protein [Pseudomonadota bacterium]